MTRGIPRQLWVFQLLRPTWVVTIFLQGYNSHYVQYNTPDFSCAGWWAAINVNKVDLLDS